MKHRNQNPLWPVSRPSHPAERRFPAAAICKRAAPRLFLFIAACSLLIITGCWSKSDSEVVVYTAQDQEFAEPLFAEFTKKTSIAVQPKFDAESTKTVGLATELEQEAA